MYYFDAVSILIVIQLFVLKHIGKKNQQPVREECLSTMTLTLLLSQQVRLFLCMAEMGKVS